MTGTKNGLSRLSQLLFANHSVDNEIENWLLEFYKLIKQEINESRSLYQGIFLTHFIITRTNNTEFLTTTNVSSPSTYLKCILF